MDIEKIRKLIAKALHNEGYYIDSSEMSNFDPLIRELQSNYNSEKSQYEITISRLEAKIYCYEKIISNSNFKSAIDKKNENK